MTDEEEKDIPEATRELSYLKLFVIATEGEKTEPQYFDMFKYDGSSIRIQFLKHDATNPLSVLKRMKEHLYKEKLKPSDEAWHVVDKDQWPTGQLDQLCAWEQKCSNYGLAISNPNFEYWLLLHFEDGTDINSGRKCIERLKRHLPQYNKAVCARHFTRIRIDDAIQRARQRDHSSCSNYPFTIPGSTVYKLVETIRMGSGDA